LALSFSLIAQNNHAKIRQQVITMTKQICFFTLAASISNNYNSHPYNPKPLAMQAFLGPSVSFGIEHQLYC